VQAFCPITIEDAISPSVGFLAIAPLPITIPSQIHEQLVLPIAIVSWQIVFAADPNDIPQFPVEQDPYPIDIACVPLTVAELIAIPPWAELAEFVPIAIPSEPELLGFCPPITVPYGPVFTAATPPIVTAENEVVHAFLPITTVFELAAMAQAPIATPTSLVAQELGPIATPPSSI
jgi:hypothetical protein